MKTSHFTDSWGICLERTCSIAVTTELAKKGVMKREERMERRKTWERRKRRKVEVPKVRSRFEPYS